MRSLLPLLFAIMGCERTVRVLDVEPADACATCDAGSAFDGSFPHGDSRFGEAGTREDFRALAEALDGSYAGVTDTDPAQPFSLRFDPSGAGQGRFAVRCLATEGCDPFGLGSAAQGADGHFALLFVDREGRGQGELEWGQGLEATRVAFWDLTRRGGGLSLVVGHAGLSRDLGFYATLELTPEGEP